MDDRLKVGNRCYLKAQGNKERTHRGRPFEEWIYEAEIVKVGRKYFTVSRNGYETKYSIEDFSEVTNYCSDWAFYFSKQDIIDEMEIGRLESIIRDRFSRYGRNSSKLTLEQLRRINDIISENK